MAPFEVFESLLNLSIVKTKALNRNPCLALMRSYISIFHKLTVISLLNYTKLSIMWMLWRVFLHFVNEIVSKKLPWRKDRAPQHPFSAEENCSYTGSIRLFEYIYILRAIFSGSTSSEVWNLGESKYLMTFVLMGLLFHP